MLAVGLAVARGTRSVGNGKRKSVRVTFTEESEESSFADAAGTGYHKRPSVGGEGVGHGCKGGKRGELPEVGRRLGNGASEQEICTSCLGKRLSKV